MNTPSQVADAPAQTSPEADTLAAVTAVHAEAQKMATEARAALEQARGDVELAEAASASATAAHVDAPEDRKVAAAAITAEGTLSLARKRLEAANTKVARADEALAGAAKALEGAKREARKPELRQKASPAALVAALDAPTRAMLTSAAAFRDAVLALRKAHEESVVASTELRALGEPVSDLHPLHAIAPALRQLAQLGLTPPGHNVNPHIESLAVNFRKDVNPDLDSMTSILVMVLGAKPARADYAGPAFDARLAKFQTVRGIHDLWALERAEEKARASGAPPPAAPPMRRHSIDDRMSFARLFRPGAKEGG